MKALVVKTSSMGDIIHTLPALTDAMNAIPGIRFDWVAEEAFAEIPSWHPAVDRVIPVALRRWRKAPWRTYFKGEWSHYKKALQAEAYDAIIDAQGLAKSALLVTRLGRGPRYGLDRESAREPMASRFYDHPMAIAKRQHAVERVRQLFAKVLHYEMPRTMGDAAIAQHFAHRQDGPYLVFLHGTTRRDKHWPDVYWDRLAGLAVGAGWKIRLLWSNTAEHARANRLAAVSPSIEVMPRLNLTQVAGELAGARAVVSVDTGLSHLAAALDRPNVILFGPTDPGLVGGYGANQLCLRAGDYPKPAIEADPPDLASLAPELVWAQLTALLKTADHRPL